MPVSPSARHSPPGQLTGVQSLVTSLAGDCHMLDPFFDSTDYIGAIDPTKPSWLTSPWISFELQ
jgi:hypothetical protein